MTRLFDETALPKLAHRLLWEAIVDIADIQTIGMGPYGERRIVPILGGEFRGGPDYPRFHGKVLSGGADRQLVRHDGTKELDALYEMEVADGTVITIRNRVIIDEPEGGPRYALSNIQATAPSGTWEWLSRRLIVGTLQSAKPHRDAVIIRSWLMSEA